MAPPRGHFAACIWCHLGGLRHTNVFVNLPSDGALNRRVYRGLRQAILEGRYAASRRLPSTRALAAELRVSRNVVMMAFEQLRAEGYIESRVGSGSFVAATLPDVALAAWRAPQTSRPSPAPTRLSAHARRVIALAPLPPPGAPLKTNLRYDFRYGIPAVEDFPHATWRRLLVRRAHAASLRTLRYGRAPGFEPLRRVLADYLTRSRGLACTFEQVIVVNGSQQALNLVAKLLLDAGDHVAVEEPCYQGARNVFVAAGARVVPVPVDGAGLDVSRLPRSGRVRFVYVTPSNQFPLGGLMPLTRRLGLLRWAEARGAHVLEDDYDGEFRYEERPLQAVQGLDRSGRVLYVGTFSKVLYPSLRLGYLIVPPALVPTVAALKFLTDFHTPTFEQEVLAEFIAEGHFEQHLRRSRSRNASRRAALLEALRETFGNRIEICGANAGVHVVVWFRDYRSSQLVDIIKRAAHAGLGIYSVKPFYMRQPRLAGVLFGYASLTERDIRAGIRLLREILQG
jgi:GntR family transcriptional regulator / MocR family aminotransferase